MSEIFPYINEFIPNFIKGVNCKILEDYRSLKILSKGEFCNNYSLKMVDQFILINSDKKIFVTRELPYVLGFYSDYDIEFDIYIKGEFQQHYLLTKGNLSILKLKDEPTIHFSKICSSDENALEIKNITTTYPLITDEIKIVVLGLELGQEKFNEILNKHNLMENIKYSLS